MNYEEKYKEALEKAKEFYILCKKCGAKDTIDFLEDSFPELAESEDEKIRKEIISYIKSSGAVTNPNWIAWLEKQKEYESTDFEYVWDRTDCGELTSALDKYSEEAIINMCHAWYDKGIELERKSWLEKQGKQKPEKKELNKIEQKSAWSEEDEKNLTQCIEAIDACYKWDSMIDWLKSLKQRYTWKPNKEQLKFLQHYADQSY